MDLLAQLSWMDLVVILLLAIGVFAGYLWGLVRGIVSCLVVLAAFIFASLLKRPIFDLLGSWTAFSDPLRELLIYLVLFAGFVIGGMILVRLYLRHTRAPLPKVVDELGGGVVGFVFAALVIAFHVVVLDSLYLGQQVAGSGPLHAWYDAFNSSLIVVAFRDSVIPLAGFVARPFVPGDVASLLVR